MTALSLLSRYNVPVPRYTSYPTVPVWNDTIPDELWKENFRIEFSRSNDREGISLYLHLPFCESLCTYCGCNKKITTDHSVEPVYMKAILAEWQAYRALMAEQPVIRELHLGGGTPTFFSPARLQALVSIILEDTIIHPDHEFSFEGHPNNTTEEHMQLLYNIGFRRVSFGVQDNDAEVQRIINRIQPFEQVKYVTETARRIGYKSVNFDLIYGLPLQTVESMEHTIRQTISLRPDRVAFYSYAHVPWTSRGQRLFDEKDLPGTNEKLELYQVGKKLFTENGYHDIGMDHFSLETDDLYQTARAGNLHRNFMGYTTQPTKILVGLGVSAISSTRNAYAQNSKKIHDYSAAANAGKMAVEKGYFLTEEDVRFGKYIRDISCNGSTHFDNQDLETIEEFCFPQLEQLFLDGLITYNHATLQVTQLGKNFIRNICSAFDLYLNKNRASTEKRIFSNAI